MPYITLPVSPNRDSLPAATDSDEDEYFTEIELLQLCVLNVVVLAHFVAISILPNLQRHLKPMRELRLASDISI